MVPSERGGASDPQREGAGRSPCRFVEEVLRHRGEAPAEYENEGRRILRRRVSVLMLVKLARILDTSVEELAGLKMPIRPKRRLSPAGVRHAECYQQLSKTEQRFVKKIIDTLLGRVAAQESIAGT